MGVAPCTQEAAAADRARVQERAGEFTWVGSSQHDVHSMKVVSAHSGALLVAVGVIQGGHPSVRVEPGQ